MVEMLTGPAIVASILVLAPIGAVGDYFLARKAANAFEIAGSPNYKALFSGAGGIIITPELVHDLLLVDVTKIDESKYDFNEAGTRPTVDK